MANFTGFSMLNLNPEYVVLASTSSSKVQTAQLLTLANRLLQETYDLRGVYVVRESETYFVLYTLEKAAGAMTATETIEVSPKRST